MPINKDVSTKPLGISDKFKNKVPREIEMLKDYFQHTFCADCMLCSLEFSKSLLLMLLLTQIHHQRYQLIL